MTPTHHPLQHRTAAHRKSPVTGKVLAGWFQLDRRLAVFEGFK